MKTTIKLGMLTAAFLLAFASCSNIVKDPVAATDDVAKSVVTEHSATGKGFTVDKIEGYVYGDIATTTNAQYQVKITFSHRPDEASVKDGVTFKTLKNKSPADPYSMPDVKDADLKPAVQFVDNEVYFTFNKTVGDIKHLYVFVDATKVKAVNGAKLNHDKDDIQGEVGDDSYAVLLNTDSSLIGNTNYEQELSDGNDCNTKKNKTWALKAEIGVDPSVVNADKYMLKRVKLLLADLPYVAVYKDEDYNAMANSLTGHINNHVKIEEYDWKEGKWNPVTASFSYVSGDHAWYASVSIPEGHYARAKFIDRDKAEKYTGKKLRGYDIKYTLANEIEGASPEHEIGHSFSWSKPSFPKEAAYFWTKDDVDVEITKPGRVSIEFKGLTKSKTFDNSSVEKGGAYVTNGWHKVSFKNKLGTTKRTLFRGFDESTVRAKKDGVDGVYANFKCFKADGSLLAIKDIKVIKSDVDNFPEALNKIIILFEDSKAEAKDVYISPDVKTQSFTGSDLDASPVADFLFPSMSFANPKPYTETSSPDKNALYGWNKLTN